MQILEMVILISNLAIDYAWSVNSTDFKPDTLPVFFQLVTETAVQRTVHAGNGK